MLSGLLQTPIPEQKVTTWSGFEKEKKARIVWNIELDLKLK